MTDIHALIAEHRHCGTCNRVFFPDEVQTEVSTRYPNRKFTYYVCPDCGTKTYDDGSHTGRQGK